MTSLSAKAAAIAEQKKRWWKKDSGGIDRYYPPVTEKQRSMREKFRAIAEAREIRSNTAEPWEEK